MSKKTIILIVALVVSVGGLVTFTVIYPFGSLEQALDSYTSTPAEEETAAPEIMPPTYVDVPTFTIPVIENGRIKATVVLTLQLDVPKDEAGQVKSQMPMIRDLLLRDLHDYLPKHLAERQQPDLFVLKQHLTDLTKAATEGRVNEVVIKGAFTR